MELKTFSNDCTISNINPEFNELHKKYEGMTRDLIKQWVSDCYNLNIESTSHYGLFFQMINYVYTETTMDLEYRIQVGKL